MAFEPQRRGDGGQVVLGELPVRRAASGGPVAQRGE
jgi:hypothetical protein